MTAVPGEITNARHVVDIAGLVWTVVHDGGMVTRADYGGIHSAGVQWLWDNFGPLYPFDGAAWWHAQHRDRPGR